MQPAKTLPEGAHVIVVPVSNPETAPALLRMAAALLAPEKSQLIATYIPTENEEDRDSEYLELLEPIIEAFREEGHPVELQVHPAQNVARGILDVARETSAELLILGAVHPDDHLRPFSGIIRSVTMASPCDVLIYSCNSTCNFERIVVPVDGSDHARTACQTALWLRERFGVPFVAVAVQRPNHSRAEALSILDRSLRGLPGVETVERRVVSAGDAISGLMNEVNGQDLIVLGFARREVFRKWLFGDFSRRFFDQAPSPILLTTPLPHIEGGLLRQLDRYLHWVLPSLTDVEQDEIVWRAGDMAAPNLNYFVLIVISAAVASAGLLLNSTAIIIGAMLIAPMMLPMLAFSVGLTTGQIPLMRRAAPTALLGFIIAVVISTILGNLTVLTEPNEQMLANSQPTVLDALVAAAAGAIAAFAMGRKDIPTATAGVAVAASIEPPICTIGLGLAIGNPNLALGAAILFLINMVCITLAGWGVFFWMGLRPRVERDSYRRRNISWAAFGILALVVVIALINLSNRETTVDLIRERLIQAFAPAELVNINLESGEMMEVLVTLRSTEPILPDQVAEVQDRLAAELRQPFQLSVVVQTMIRVTPEVTAAP